MCRTQSPNYKSNYVVDLVQYHVNTLPYFQDILEKSGEKVNFRGWLSIRMKLAERPVICLGQDESIFKQYIFTKNMWYHKGKFRLVTKDEGYVIMISALQS